MTRTVRDLDFGSHWMPHRPTEHAKLSKVYAGDELVFATFEVSDSESYFASMKADDAEDATRIAASLQDAIGSTVFEFVEIEVPRATNR